MSSTPLAPAVGSAINWPSGLVAPDQSWVFERLGLTAVPAESEWPDDLVDVYLTAPEYLFPVASSLVISAEPRLRCWIGAILRQHPRQDLVCALAALNHAAQHPDHAMRYQQQFLSRLRPEVAGTVQAALDGAVDGKPRVFLARQCVLRALRTVLVPDGDQPTVPEPMAAFVRSVDLTTSAVLLVHFVAAQLRSRRSDGESKLGGMPESLAMETIANSLFNGVEDAGSLIARTRLLWHGYDPKLVQPTPRLSPVEMLKEAVGIDLDEVLALGFAYYAYASARRFDSPIRMNPFIGHLIGRDTVETFLSRFAATLDELSEGLRSCTQRWQLLPIQDRPLVRIGDDIVVLDEQYLIDRVTRGLYWLVHDHESEAYGDGARLCWTQVYAKMIELRVEGQLCRLAPPLVGGGSTYFTEEDLQAAFPKSKAVDIGIDFGDATVLAEIVNAQVTVPTRTQCDSDAFKRDVERMVLKKARQLDDTAKNLLRDPQPAKSPLPTPARKVFPIVVHGGAFPVNPATRRYIEEYLGQEKLLDHTDARMQPLALVDLEELELCEALSSARGTSLPAVLAGWQGSPYRGMSLCSYLTQELRVADVGRPADVQAALDRAFAAIAERLGTAWPPPTSSNENDPSSLK